MTTSTKPRPDWDHRAGPEQAYTPANIEQKWQKVWREARSFTVPPPHEERENACVFVPPPFTSGDAHIGHVRNYAIADANARFRRARGEAVLFSIGFDAFGLPAEIGAVKHSQSPAQWVERCCKQMKQQFDRLGFSVDWSRSYITSEPDMYRWSQWLFLMLHDADLVFRRNAYVDWCESCRTVLATIQVHDGRCWRCHEPVRLVRRPQWYFRLSAYNEENERRLDQLPWNDRAIEAQRSLLGRVDGVEFEALSPGGVPLTVFTALPDAISDAAFVALSPRHPELDAWLTAENAEEDLASLLGGISREGRGAGDLPVHETGSVIKVSGVDQPLPVVVSAAVDARYGPTAVLGIPTMDRSDQAIAKRLTPGPGAGLQIRTKPMPKRPAVRYRASDFSISRQRAWGAPVPIVHCDRCGTVPVPADELPVRLPKDLLVTGAGNALAERDDFLPCRCPSCEGPARRDTDTLDCCVDIFCIYMASAVPREDRGNNLVRHPELKRWLPVSQTVRGGDTGGFALDERAVAKALRDLGQIEVLPDGEPFGPTLMHGIVRMNGRKMSKHLGNAITPSELIEETGADALRFAVLHAAAPAKDFAWHPSVLREAHEFLARLWEHAGPRLRGATDLHPWSQIDTSTKLRRRLRGWCETALERTTENFEAMALHRATRNVMALLVRIVDFERRVLEKSEALTESDRKAIAGALLLDVQLLAPLAPHLAEELWHCAGQDGLLCEQPWPVE